MAAAKRKRRWWLWLLLSLGALVALIVALLLAVLWVPAVSRFAVAQGLSRWDASMPGRVEWRSIDGSIAGGLEIDGLAVFDGDDLPLVRAEYVELELEVLPLFGGTAEVERLRLEGVEVWLDHNWADLANPDAPTPPPKPGYGPDLPVEIIGTLELDDGRVWRDDAEFVSLGRLTVDAWGQGRQAKAALAIADIELGFIGVGEGGDEPLRVDALALEARWDSPVATLERFDLSAPIATLEQLAGTYDVEARAGVLRLAVDGHADAIADQFGVEPLRAADHAQLDLRAEGGPGGLEAFVDLNLGAAGQLRVHGRGVPTGPLAQRWASVDVEGRVGAGLLDQLQGPVMVDLRATIDGRGDAGFVAGIAGRIDDLHGPERLDLVVDAAADDVDPLIGRASVGLHGAGLEFDASVEHPDPSTLAGTASLRIDDLERPLTLAASLLGMPELRELRGALTLEGRCFTREADKLDSLRCPLQLELAQASGFDVALERAQLDAYLDPLADPLTLAAALDVEDLRLGGGREAGRGDAFVFDALALEAGGSLERLRFDAAGYGTHERFGLAGAIERSDERLAVGLERLELFSDRGRPVTQVGLRHPTRVTYVDQLVDVDTLSLVIAGRRGDGDAAGDGGRVDIDGRLDLDADRARSDFDVAIDSVDLARLDPLIPGLRLAGDLSVRAAVQGSLRDPNAWALIQAKRLRVADYRPGTLGLVAILGQPQVPAQAAAPIVQPALAALPIDEALEFDNDGLQGGLRVWAYSAGPMARRINLAAAVPLTLVDGPGLEPGGTLAVRVAVEKFNLTALAALMPDTPSWWRQLPAGSAAPPGDPKLIPEGRVDLDLAIGGTVEQPRMHAMVRARDLTLDRTELGSMLLRASFDDDGLGIDLDAKPGFTQIELHAQVPVDLDLARGRLDWSPATDGHLVSLDVRAFDLDALQATLGPKLPDLEAALGQARVSGSLAVSLRGSGSLEAPELGLVVRGADLRFRDRTLGQLGMLAGYTRGRAEAEFHLDGPLARRLDARVVAPIEYRFGEDQPLRLDTDAPIEAEVHVAELAFVDVERYLGPLPVAGELELEIGVHGRLADPQVDLLTRIDGFALAGDPLGDIRVRAALDHGRGLLDAKLERGTEELLAVALEIPLLVDISANPGDSTLAWEPGGNHRIYVKGRGLDDELLSALIGRGFGPPPGTLVGGERGRGTEIDLDIAGGGRLDDFRLDGQIGGLLPVDDELGLTLAGSFHLDEATQRVELSLDPSEGEGFDAALELAAAVPALVGGEQSIRDIEFSAKVAAPDFNLHCAAGLLPAGLVNPTGYLRAKFSGHGTVGAPIFSGDLVLDDAALTVLALRQRLTEIDVDLEFADQRLEINGLTATAGRGSLRAHGHAALTQAPEIYAELDLQIDRFPLVRPGLPAMAVDSKVGLELRRWADGTAIDVALADTEVTVAGVNEAPPKAIPSSAKVTFVSDAEAPGIDASEPPEPLAPVDAAKDEQGRFTLSLDLSDPLLIIGAAIDMAWVGALELSIEAGAVDVGGELEARRGRLRLLNNSFDLRRGKVTLPDDGSLDPYLDVEAVATTAEAEVTVTVRGRVSRPALEFSSTPPLSEYQILTLLVTGSTEIGGDDGEVSAKAASLLAAVSNPQLQAQLNRHLGIDRAEIGFGETIDQPILTVGKRITRNVYVETTYHHNAPEDENTAQVGVEYGIVPHVTAESYFGDASVGGFGLYWTRSFPALRWGARFGRNDESKDDADP